MKSQGRHATLFGLSMLTAVTMAACAAATPTADRAQPAGFRSTETTDGAGSGKDSGGGPDSSSDATEVTEATSGETVESTVVPPGEAAEAGPITSYQDVQPAVVQIIAYGTFRDPEIGVTDGSGAGSGFIISPDGLAVTNNHVVTGAATLDVFIGGDTTPHNARIIGTSECNDLALIDIDYPDDLAYLDWYTDPIEVGLDVYAAGFPLGDPEFTLTRGIVSKIRANGDITGTSSIEHTIEHDAAIQHGNSGGPLVSVDGRVVGINYAGGITEESQVTAQYYAIASDLARPVITRLEDGDFESLGINGFSVASDSGDLSGIWVAGVKAGTGASSAGLLPGDVILAMNGLPVGTDGSMADYCDVLRTSGDDGAISVDVLRFDTGEELRGEINGNAPLTVVGNAGQQTPDTGNSQTPGTDGPDTPGTGTPQDPSTAGFDTLTDDTGLITVDVPTTWSDRNTSAQTLDDGTEVPSIGASPNLQEFSDTWTTPGVIVSAYPYTADVDGVLAQSAFSDCTAGPARDYSDPVFTGKSQRFDNCAGTQSSIVVIVANPSTSSATIRIVFQLTGPDDQAVLDQVIGTFNVTR